jgi:zinc transporter ZupT
LLSPLAILTSGVGYLILKAVSPQGLINLFLGSIGKFMIWVVIPMFDSHYMWVKYLILHK